MSEHSKVGTPSPPSHEIPNSSTSSCSSEGPARDGVGIASQMSGSYHEIFDSSQMSSPSHQGGGGGGGDCYYNSPDRGLLHFCTDGNTVKTTEYLTTKLVEDSLKYQWDNTTPYTPDAFLEPSPRLDPEALADMERHSRHLASSVDNLIESLSDVLHHASGLTVNSIEIYRDAVCKTCDEVDGNIKSMYQLMAKAEEINKAMAPAYHLAEQIKDVKKLLDMFENAYSIR
uniref:CG17180like [Acyrthosiphon pisum] n=1 Tax=Lepeophtheirus salmonis TaxID=72036 RepID=A0A0K2TG87_LEPSM